MYRKLRLSVALIGALSTFQLCSLVVTYTGPKSGNYNWTNNANWFTGTYPDGNDTVQIIGNGNNYVNLSTSVNVGRVVTNLNGSSFEISNPDNTGQITFVDVGASIIDLFSSVSNGSLTFQVPIVVRSGLNQIAFVDQNKTLYLGKVTGHDDETSTILVYADSANSANSEVFYTGGGDKVQSFTIGDETNNYAIAFQLENTLPTNSPNIDIRQNSSFAFTDTRGTYSGDISGAGDLIVDNNTQTSNMTFTGALTSTGNLWLGGTDVTITSIPNFSNIDLAYATVPGNLTFQLNTNGTFSGNITNNQDASGCLHKQGTGTLTLDGTTLDYLGETTVEGGTLKFVTSPSGTASITLSNSSTLEFAPATGTSQTLSTPITGAGSVTMSGAGTLTLSGTDLSYTGNTAVTGGTLSLVKSPSATPQISITAGKTLQFAPASGDSQSFTGVITGAGAVIMNGEGVQNLSGASTYTGATTVSQGTLNLNSGAALLSDITLNSGSSAASTAILSGSGSITGTVTATKGFVEVGPTTSSTLSTGVYSQSTNSTLKVPISRESAGKLAVTGDATLDGTLEVDFQPGTYPAGTSYTVLTATGALNDTAFNLLVEGTSGTWNITYTDDNTVTVSTPTGAQTHPVPISSLRGNERSVADYMYDDQSFVHSNADLTEVSHAMNILPAAEFEDSLLRVSSLPYAAQDGALLFGDVQMAQTFDPYSRGGNSQGASLALATETSEDTDYLLAEQTLLNTPAGNAAFEETSSTPCLEASKSTGKKKIFQMPCFAITSQGAFIQPIGIYYNQREKEQQVPFDMGTYGVGAGWTQVFGDQFFLTAGVGYTHSNLDWKNNYGNSNWSTVYVAPVVGWFGNRAFANLTVMGAFNFIKADRRIVFPGINRVAKSRYNAYDLLLKGNGGMRFAVFDFIPRSWFQPEVTLNYLTIFTEEYTESGANSINLNVQKRTNYLLQPSFRAKLIKEVITKKYCYAPSLYVGWLANIPLNADNMQARFTGAPNQTLFNITGYNQTTNQLILGAGFFMKRAEKFELQSDFEVDMLSKYEIYNFKVNFQWLF